MAEPFKKSHALSFEPGVLEVKTEGWDGREGNGHIAFHERELHWERNEDSNDCTVFVPLARSELIAIRDFLNDRFPIYRCYSCKQVFEEDHGHGLAREHFGSHLAGDQPKCLEILKGTATWGGGPHDPFYRVNKKHYDALEKEVAVLRAKVQDFCPGHVASLGDSKVCGRCGLHISELADH